MDMLTRAQIWATLSNIDVTEFCTETEILDNKTLTYLPWMKAHEIMMGTPAIRNLIREDKVAQMYSAIQTGGALGMQTLDQCLQGLVKSD